MFQQNRNLSMSTIFDWKKKHLVEIFCIQTSANFSHGEARITPLLPPGAGVIKGCSRGPTVLKQLDKPKDFFFWITFL